MAYRPDVIISGGQTGADQGGLRAAKDLGLGTGGYAPKGWKTEDGPAPWLGTEYDLVESDSPYYEDRTRLNVYLADGTIIFGRRSVGSNLTEEICRQKNKPCAWLFLPPDSRSTSLIINANPNAFRLWLVLHKIHILNVAGNRESVNPGIGKLVESFLMEALK